MIQPAIKTGLGEIIEGFIDSSKKEGERLVTEERLQNARIHVWEDLAKRAGLKVVTRNRAHQAGGYPGELLLERIKPWEKVF